MNEKTHEEQLELVRRQSTKKDVTTADGKTLSFDPTTDASMERAKEEVHQEIPLTHFGSLGSRGH